MSRLAFSLLIVPGLLLSACFEPPCGKPGGCGEEDAGTVLEDAGSHAEDASEWTWDASISTRDASHWTWDASTSNGDASNSGWDASSTGDASDSSWDASSGDASLSTGDASYPPDPCSPSTSVTGGLKVAVLDVGQGDAIAVIAPSGCAAVIDSGPNGSGSTVKRYFQDQGVEEISWAAVSHYHADHIGAFDEIETGADSMRIPTVYDRGDGTGTSATYLSYVAAFRGRRQQVSLGQTLTLCDEVCFQVVAVNGNGSTSDENALSVAMKLIYGGFSMLLGGDLSGASPNMEATIKNAVGEVDVYKVHHHGSRSSSTADFLGALKPTASIVSAGAYNSFNHPTAEVLARLAAVGSDVWRTEEWTHPVGHVEIEVETGTQFRVTQDGRSAEYSVKPVR